MSERDVKPDVAFVDDDGRVMVADDPAEPSLVREYLPAAEVERLRARVLKLESLGAVNVVAGPLQQAINEAARLLSGALKPGAIGRPVRSFTRGEMADIETALCALHRVRSDAYNARQT